MQLHMDATRRPVTQRSRFATQLADPARSDAKLASALTNLQVNKSLPRASGAVPASANQACTAVPSSPRERGCSDIDDVAQQARGVFPARAGLFPERARCQRGGSCLPRASGAVPSLLRIYGVKRPSSPRERGCSPGTGALGVPPGVFPARAGLFPRLDRRRARRPRLPRASGAVPRPRWRLTRGSGSSPRERGCSPGLRLGRRGAPVFPARAGLFPGSTCSSPPPPTSSPRKRGCSLLGRALAANGVVFPARAGLFRDHWCGRLVGVGLPRASGAVPGRAAACPLGRGVFPARAGLFPRPAHPAAGSPCLPRASGAVPSAHDDHVFPARAGRSRCEVVLQAGVTGLPHASGTVPVRRRLRRGVGGLPRASGAVPAGRGLAHGRVESSPRERGCSPVPLHGLGGLAAFPALAGLFPGAIAPRLSRWSSSPR